MILLLFTSVSDSTDRPTHPLTPPFVPFAVKRGKISAASGDQQKPNSEQQHNTFLVLKLENVKSQTLPLKGVDPAWDEEFLL